MRKSNKLLFMDVSYCCNMAHLALGKMWLLMSLGVYVMLSYIIFRAVRNMKHEKLLLAISVSPPTDLTVPFDRLRGNELCKSK